MLGGEVVILGTNAVEWLDWNHLTLHGTRFEAHDSLHDDGAICDEEQFFLLQQKHLERLHEPTAYGL